MHLLSAGLDLNYLTTISRGDKEFINEVCTLFESKVPEMMLEIHKALISNHWEEMKFYAHKLKSTYAVFGNTYMIDLLNELEELQMPDDHLQKVHGIYELIKVETDKCLHDMHQIKLNRFS